MRARLAALTDEDIEALANVPFCLLTADPRRLAQAMRDLALGRAA
jgi:hypothetical protein